jgi:hypothetical protein
LTVDAKGRILTIGNVAIAFPSQTLISNTAEITANTTFGTPGLNLTSTGVVAGTYGGAVNIPQITVDAKGRVTSASVSALDLSLYAPLASPTFTGTVSASVLSVSASSTLGTVTSGTWNATNIALGSGGTNASLTAANGAVVYSTSSALALTGVGTAGQVLTSNGAGAPTWQAAASGGFDAFLLAGL